MQGKLVLTLALLLGGGTPAFAQPSVPESNTQPSTRPATEPADFPRPGTLDGAFEVSAASAEAPEAAPHDALWPDPLVYTRDNAATLYLAGMIQIPAYDDRMVELSDRLLDATPETIDADEATEYLDKFDVTFQIIEPTVNRPRAVWDWPWREQGFLTLLPHLNEMRYVSNTLTFGIKLDLSRGDFESAARRLKQLYVMGPHAGAHDEAIYVEGLVGVGLAAQATRSAMTFAEQTDAPNLYHALRALPEPMFKVRPWIEMEHRVFQVTAPRLYDPETMDEAAWNELWRQFGWMAEGQDWNYYNLSAEKQVVIARTLAAKRRKSMEPIAIAYFSARGEEEQRLAQQAAENPYPLLARYMTTTLGDYFTEAAAASQLPFGQAYPRLRRLHEQAQAIDWLSGDDSLASPFHRGLLSQQRLRQQIAAVTVLEALRDHAAEHGEWPASLEDVDLYLPPDPFANGTAGVPGPFVYERDGRTIILRAGADDRELSGFEWRITLRGE